MRHVTVKGIAARKVRSLLTALGIVMGVALVSGSFILTDTVENALASAFTSSYDDVDAVVTAPRATGLPGVPPVAVTDSLLAQVRALPEVAHAAGTLVDFSGERAPATVLDQRGRPVDGGGPTFAFGVDPEDSRFNPLELVAGRWAAGGGEVVVDAETAARHRFRLGDPVEVVAGGQSKRFTVVGLARFGDTPTDTGATAAVFDLATARELHGVDGYFAIAATARAGVTREQLVGAISTMLPIGVEVRTGQQQAAEDAEAVSFVGTVRYLLVAFGAVAVLVGAFVIVNSLSITVALRTRELATLRMLGATRRQVRRSVLLEGLLLGIVASVAGLAAGFLFAEGLRFVFGTLGVRLPDAPTVLRARTAVVSLAVGVAVTSLATLVPALRATRVPPIAAVRDPQAASAAPRSPRTARTGLVLLVLGSSMTAWRVAGPKASSGEPALLVALGGLLALAGTILLAPALVRPVTSWLARPLAAVGGSAARIARDNAIRNPSRTATTAAALTIGVALMTFASVVAHAVLGSGERSVREQVSADYIVGSPNGWPSEREDVGRAAAATPGIDAAASIRTIRGGAALDRRMVGVSGVDTASIAQVYRFRWKEGSDATVAGLRPDGALVDDDLAAQESLAVGDRIVLRTRGGDGIELVVQGVFERPAFDSLLGEVVVAQDVFGAAFPPQASALTLVRAEDRPAVERLLRSVPHAELLTPAGVAATRHAELRAVLRLLYVLLALAVLVSVIGLVNTMALATVERTREIGMLRAVGMRRRDIRRMVRYESILTALLGSALAIPLGVASGAAVVASAGQAGFALSLPVGTLVAVVAATVLLGVAAAALPARRAARLDVVEALQHD